MDSEHRGFAECDPPSKPKRFSISKSTNLSQRKIETFLIPRSQGEKADVPSDQEAIRETEKDNFGPTEQGSVCSIITTNVSQHG
ncbi:unnamed protein product [Allacma fusca]|uniref:Uncharacterized protein n=1 Tax=Allacma fusca TaxID=39272 RepID=A0A8J2PIM7_9HEXA|nr:unnamed protein product [Allacma fusca]